MREERLLERMSSMELDPLRREGHDQGRLVDSIVGHLRCILNTRQGCVPIAPDLGAPDFLDFLQGYPDSVREIELSLRRTIEMYEPRLESVQVVFTPQAEDPLALHFQINARLRNGGPARVRLETVVGAGGEVSIRR